MLSLTGNIDWALQVGCEIQNIFSHKRNNRERWTLNVMATMHFDLLMYHVNVNALLLPIFIQNWCGLH